MKKAKITLIFLFLLTLPTLLPFFNTKFFYTQDHIFIARLQQMSVALSDGQFPVRWAPDMRFGEPLFNFYAPLPYYLGAGIKLLGFNFILVAKILFILSSILSALAMYLFCRKLFSQKGAFLATALYIYAPYRAVDLYVRGALSEAFAFIFFPLIFYASLLLSQKVNLKRISFLALTISGLILTHNVTTLMFLPFLILWWIYLVVTRKNLKLTLPFFASAALGSGLAAFFLLPALLERVFIQTKYLTVGYFDFRAHFVAFYQFFSTFWGYGASLWGPKDDMSFQIGLVHWATLALAAALGFVFRKDKKLVLLFAFLGFGFLLSIFLQHNKSAFLWEAFPFMAFIQFPWRFLAISIFIVSLVGGVVADYLKGKAKIVYVILFVSLTLWNMQYFKPRNYVEDSFFDKFLQVESMRRGVDLTKDYLPVWVQTVDGGVFNIPRARVGEIEVSNLKRSSTMLNASINATTPSVVEVPITYFPGWQVAINNQTIPQITPSKMGLLRFELPKGEYQVKIQFKDTLVRMAGNMISLVSLFLLMIFFYKGYKLR